MAAGKLNRKQRKELTRQLRSEDPGLDVVHPRAAGIDVGNSAHYVAVRPDQDAEPVRRFECFTADLHRLVDWLQACGVRTVAMQATGVYWILRSRILAEHVHGASTCIQRMQKVLTQMNVQLANVISDLSGLTGQTIVRAILGGERDPRKLAELSHPQIRASRPEIAKSLEGNWRPELLFVLQQEVEMYDTYQRRIGECDRELEAHLKTFADKVRSKQAEAESASDERKGSKGQKTKPAQDSKRSQGNAPRFDLRSELYRISGVDLTRIDGIHSLVAQTVISEVGLDMSRWNTEAHFASWLGLSPDNRISGDKVLSKGTRHVVNRAATALRMAATTLLRSQSYLGAQYRRLRTKLGAPKAITAMAHKLGRLVYRMLKYGQEYVDKGMQHYEDQYRCQQVELLKKKAAKLGLQIVETQTV